MKPLPLCQSQDPCDLTSCDSCRVFSELLSEKTRQTESTDLSSPSVFYRLWMASKEDDV